MAQTIDPWRAEEDKWGSWPGVQRETVTARIVWCGGAVSSSILVFMSKLNPCNHIHYREEEVINIDIECKICSFNAKLTSLQKVSPVLDVFDFKSISSYLIRREKNPSFIWATKLSSDRESSYLKLIVFLALSLRLFFWDSTKRPLSFC